MKSHLTSYPLYITHTIIISTDNFCKKLFYNCDQNISSQLLDS
jgi:hypothetical protein